MYKIMDNSIKDRFYQVMKSLNLNDYRVYTDVDEISKNAMTKLRNGDTKDVSTKILVPFCMYYKDSNPDYILTGIGEPLRNYTNKPIRSVLSGKPYYNVDFELGFDMMVNDQTCNPEYLIDFQPYNNKATCYCNVTGNSMHPTISSGDIIALKEIKDFSMLLNDKIYAIVTTNDLRTVKRVEDRGDVIVLKPDNKDYNPQTIPRDKLSKVYQVIGSIKQF